MYPGGTSSIEEEKILLNIEQLLEFSGKLLKVTNDIRKGAYTYKVEVERKTMKSQIRGAVRWQKTALARAQKGTEYATATVSFRYLAFQIRSSEDTKRNTQLT